MIRARNIALALVLVLEWLYVNAYLGVDGMLAEIIRAASYHDGRWELEWQISAVVLGALALCGVGSIWAYLWRLWSAAQWWLSAEILLMLAFPFAWPRLLMLYLNSPVMLSGVLSGYAENSWWDLLIFPILYALPLIVLHKTALLFVAVRRRQRVRTPTSVTQLQQET
jgi:hypothetical protein